MATENEALAESIGDPALTIGVSIGSIAVKIAVGAMADVLRLSQAVIDLAGGDSAKGGYFVGSPLALAFASRCIAREALGHPGWRDDFDQSLAIARTADPLTRAFAVMWTYGFAIAGGVLLVDDDVMRSIEEAVDVLEGAGDDGALGLARIALGQALVHRDPPDFRRGQEVFANVRDMIVQGRFPKSELAAMDFLIAFCRAKLGDRDDALPSLRESVDAIYEAGQFGYCVLTTEILVETLLDRSADGDTDEAEKAIDRLAHLGDRSTSIEISLLRSRALLARASGDEATYRELADKYRAMATSLGFEGHMAMAEAM